MTARTTYYKPSIARRHAIERSIARASAAGGHPISQAMFENNATYEEVHHVLHAMNANQPAKVGRPRKLCGTDEGRAKHDELGETCGYCGEDQ